MLESGSGRGDYSDRNFLGSRRMVTEGNGELGSTEEVREGQLIGPTLQSVVAFLMEDRTQKTTTWLEWLESHIRRLVRDAFEHFLKSGLASVGAFLREDNMQNPFPGLDPHSLRLVRVAFEHFMKPGLASVAAFLMEDSTQNTSPWLESYIRALVCEAFEHYVLSGPAMVGRREQIQELDRRIFQLHFETSMPDHFCVGKKVKGRDGAICVKLTDATTGHAVESGPLSSLTLDVVVLAGDFDKDGWTWEDFKSNVETRREGKGPLLEGDLQVPLKAGVGSLAEFKFTDISTCRRSGKFRLGVKVEPGYFKGSRVREAKTVAFKVKHYKKKSEEKHVPRALDDDVCTLKGIGRNGPFHKNLNDTGILKVKDFLWKRCLDPDGLRKILGKTVSDKNWRTLGDHAQESVPSGKYHVHYVDKMKTTGVVFENMSELCGFIENGKYNSAEILSDSDKATLKEKACANWNDNVEYDSLQPLEMNPSERACSSQTDVQTVVPLFCSALLTVPSAEASENSMLEFDDHSLDSILDDALIELSSPSPNPSEKADGNTELSVANWMPVRGSNTQLGPSPRRRHSVLQAEAMVGLDSSNRECHCCDREHELAPRECLFPGLECQYGVGLEHVLAPRECPFPRLECQ